MENKNILDICHKIQGIGIWPDSENVEMVLPSETPTKDEIKVFLDIWNKLSQFEADHRMRCGWGVWNDRLPSELPIPEVVKVYKWLEDLVK